MALHSAMRKKVDMHDNGKVMFSTLGSANREFAIMCKNPYTGKDCVYSGRYLESNILAATSRNDVKGYITKHRAQKDIHNIFLPGQNARVVTMEEAEIFLGSCYA